MPDAHWGYGFPIGGVAAFDPDEGGVVSAGGVGFDISCGVRCLHTGLTRGRDRSPCRSRSPTSSTTRIPAGVGSTGTIHLGRRRRWTRCSRGGAHWAVDRGCGEPGRPRAHRGARPDAGTPSPATVSRPGEEAPARRDGHARLRATTTSRCRKSPRIYDANAAARLRAGAGRRRRHDPLRLARARPPDRHRLPEADGDRAPRATASRSPTASWPARRSTPTVGEDYLGAMRAGDQLRARQPPDPRPISCARCSRERPAAGAAAAPLRRLAQHLQGGGAPRRRRRARALRPPQGRDPRLRPGTSRTCPTPLRAVGQPVLIGGIDGHRLVRPRRTRRTPRRGRSARPATAPAAR